MNAWKAADAVVRHPEAATPVYDVSERGCSPCVSLEDGRSFTVDAPVEGDVGIALGVRAYEGGLQLLEDLATEPRVRDDEGGWAL